MLGEGLDVLQTLHLHPLDSKCEEGAEGEGDDGAANSFSHILCKTQISDRAADE